jgi:hypothetical protein
MLPPICTGRPLAARMCASSAVVVDLPFEPVMPTTCGARSKLSQAGVANERKKRPTSLSTATPASQAAATAACGAG